MDRGIIDARRRPTWQGRKRKDAGFKIYWNYVWWSLIALIVLSWVILFAWNLPISDRRKPRSVAFQNRLVSKIAFGSSSAHDYRSQPIWTHGVIPSNLDAWIWLGNLAYMDEPRVNCDAVPQHSQCNCSNDWIHQAPFSCMAGNLEHARSQLNMQLANPDYAQFLAFMCPGHREKGFYPPLGSNASICPRGIFGTYDDSDYSWKYGNKRLPNKDNLKQIFLDGIGEHSDSPRRRHGRGIEWKYTLNQGIKGQEVDVILLDERYYRDTIPCHIRRSFCEELIRKDKGHQQFVWCVDFLQGGEGHGSCCKKDEKIIYGWCMQERSKISPYWTEACDPTSSLFGRHSFTIDVSGQLQKLESSNGESSFCEVLGRSQRLWLADTLAKSNAPLKLLVSSSVVLASPESKSCDSTVLGKELNCTCSGDDWECYKPAQLNLLQVVSRAPGCTIILTGGLEYSDIRVIRPGARSYSKYYKDVNLTYPLFQVMASGLTTSTAPKFACDDLKDNVGVREHGECAFVKSPSFGMIEVEWDGDDPYAKLQIRDGMTSKVVLESSVSLRSCMYH